MGDELADALGIPVERVRITTNFEMNPRILAVTIIGLTTAQGTEVSDFFLDNPTFTLPSFGTVIIFDLMEVAKTNDIVTLRILNVCTSVSATNFPEADYIQAFDNALASTASVTTSIGAIQGNSPECDDATPPGSTRVQTDIEVPAADLGAVLDLLPSASSTINLRGDFGEVSLGDRLYFP